ncbi:uncharacterized protein EHS24_005509 [Apiotrichum porosum]|uniref:Uncharacterized protein n=1 Tax=Apiotrichum porosum TaxID=105984 RepID=A0A427XD30_9TREE|nr:uncharacterized protein EHS24_005509 [Apiotrichum porosum]RSH76624.1 hypothetical protein EHS24_005509 [Apiotrichum porosum]
MNNVAPQATPQNTSQDNNSYHDTQTTRFDQLPLEVLSLVTSLFPPPFYPPAPLAEQTPVPEAHIVACLDPHPNPPQTVNDAISSLTKTCSHALESARPWLWENVDVRSGRGWLAVVDALTEEVVDSHPDEIEPDHEVMSSEVLSGAGIAPLTLSPTDATLAAAADPLSYASASASAAREAADATGEPCAFDAGSSSTENQAQVVPSVPVGSLIGGLLGGGGGSGTGRSTLGRKVTINTTVAQISGPGADIIAPPQPRRLSALLTPPGSRNVSPHNARLRGRSRSPRRQLAFEADGISAVLSRSLSLSSGQRPFMRQSSLSHHTRVFSDFDEDESASDESSLMTAMRTPPKDSLELPREDDMAMEDAEAVPNVNPDMLPPPGPYIRHINFINFRTIGSRRSQEEAVRGRFVTAGRLEGVIKNTPNLRSICMTEYVDSALSYPVVEEIFFRGYHKPRVFRQRSTSLSPAAIRARSVSVHPSALEQITLEDQLDPPRPVYVPYEDETDEQKWTRRNLFTPLEALDLTGCVSRAFTEAADEFGENWLNVGIPEESDDEERGRGRGRQPRRVESATDTEDDDEDLPLAERRTHRPRFHALRRLSLRACMTLPATFIQGLILCMPHLTHLDLSATRLSDSLLRTLTTNAPRGLRLQSLSLARCAQLSPHVVVDFLVDSPAARDLVELNLFVNPTQGNAIEGEDLIRLLSKAPCIRSGRLRYLDLSSAGFTVEHLSPDVFPPQPSLVSLGLSHIPELPLREVATFIQNQAPGVEILTLQGTSIRDLRPDASTLQITLALHALLINPLTTQPFSLANALDLARGTAQVDLAAGPTRLRVVELSSSITRSLTSSQGSGRTEWQVVKSKGGRGWYVDVSAGWIYSDTVGIWGRAPEDAAASGEGLARKSFIPPLARHTPQAPDGRVRSDVGWHSRKMEIVRGYGMMGREEGMGGVAAFASLE